MIYELIVSGIALACLIYYLFCFLEIFEIIKWTAPHIRMEFGKALIPFYYLFKK